MNQRKSKRLASCVLSVASSVAVCAAAVAADDLAPNASHVTDQNEPMQTGKFEPTWDSLKQYQVPAWFQNAKFGIWAHWGAQCQPEDGDWYARRMYIEGDSQYKDHLRVYGPPSKSGFKDIIHQWKAENWDPQKLVALYKRAGAQYFFALANHHDNFDNYDSKYQPWNSVKLGPQKDLIGGWAKAARDNGLKFGVSVHAAHAWSWYEVAQGADKKGPLAGVPYDGKLTKADGIGQWWDGLDPQDLYAQNHVPGKKLEWDWNARKGSSIPDAAYCQKFYDRTIDLINKYDPDMVYFDDTALPLYPISDAGLKIAAHLYNKSMKEHDGQLQAVLFGKVLTPEQRKCMVWDIERGASNTIEPEPWQTDTCIGDWHYSRSIFDHHHYKSTKTIVQTLVDIVSKNGNLLLNIPVRGDGTIDADEQAVVEGIGQWMDVNREAIFSTRPWKIFGEGPASDGAPIKAQGFNEGKGKPFTAADVRFTANGDTIYAMVLGWPTTTLTIKSLSTDAKLLDKPIKSIDLLGSKEPVKWSQAGDGVKIEPLQTKPCEHVFVFKVVIGT